MQNNNLNKEDEAAFVDSFFLPGGILDDFDDDKKEATAEDQPFFVPPLPVTSNPWDAAMAGSATASPLADLGVSSDTIERPFFGPQHLIPQASIASELEQQPQTRLSAPLPVGSERRIQNRAPPGLTATEDLLSSPLLTPSSSLLAMDSERINTTSEPSHFTSRLPNGAIRAPPGYSPVKPRAVVAPLVGSGALQYVIGLGEDTTLAGSFPGASQIEESSLLAEQKNDQLIATEEFFDASAELPSPSPEFDDLDINSSDATEIIVDSEGAKERSRKSRTSMVDSDAVTEAAVRPRTSGDSSVDSSNGDADAQSSSADTRVVRSKADEKGRPRPTTKPAPKNRRDTKRTGAPKTGLPGKVPADGPSMPIDEFRGIFGLMAGVTQWTFETIVPVFVQILGFFDMLLDELSKVMAVFLYTIWSVGKNTCKEALHSDGSIFCYGVFYITPFAHSLVTRFIVIPHWAPHVVAHALLFMLCREGKDHATTRSDAPSKPFLSSGGNLQLANGMSLTILGLIRLLLPLNFLLDGFDEEESDFFRLDPSARLITAFCLCLVRSRLLLAPMAWASWSLQVLVCFYWQSEWQRLLDLFLLFVGLTSIHLIRAIDSENVLKDVKLKI